MRSFLGRTAIFLIAVAMLVHASVSDSELQNQYGNKVLTLRRFYSGHKLHFDSDGKPFGDASGGPWTLDSELRVDKISVKNGMIHIQGHRLFLISDASGKQMRDISTLAKADTGRHGLAIDLVNWAKEEQVSIDITCGKANPEQADVETVMRAVFLGPDEELGTVAPAYWKRWLENQSGKTENPASARQNVLKVGGGVSPPHAISTPDPQYSTLARQAAYQGTVVLWLIVGEDGSPHDIQIVRALGMGLDDNAVAAVKEWKFDPAKKDLTSVAVQINVEVNFRLY